MSNHHAALAAFSISLCLGAGSASAAAADRGAIARTIKGEVAQLMAGINAHDPVKATLFDAPDVISMECGRPSSTGAAADLAGFKMAFGYAPSWRVSLIDEAVDVARSGDLAIYRATANQDSANDGVAMTEKVNFVAEFRKQADGSWKMAWTLVAPMERPHKK